MTTLITDTAEKAPIIKDRFASSEYNDLSARLATLQALRGEKGDVDCGYFLTEAELRKAGWYNVKIEDLTTYEFNSGSKERGILIKSPRMLVVQRSPLFAIDRQASLVEKRMVVVGVYSRQLHKDREKYGLGQYYEVMLLDENNQPLHESPLGYLAKGANQASFSTHWQQLVNEVTRCHAIANQIPTRPKNASFTSLCVLKLKVKRELAGNNLKSYACKVDSHESPTQDNWESFFLGRDSATADFFLNLLAPSPVLTMLAVASMALPPAENEADDGFSDAQLVPESLPSVKEKLEPTPLPSPELKAVKRLVINNFEALGWDAAKRKDWALNRHDCMSGSWTLQEWREANADLQKLLFLPELEPSF